MSNQVSQKQVEVIVKPKPIMNNIYLDSFKYVIVFSSSHNLAVGQNCVDRDFCSALQNSGKKCDAELKELCPVYCGLCEGMREIKFVDWRSPDLL